MSRPASEDSASRALTRSAHGLRQQLEDKTLNMITLKELEFCRLLAVEGYTQRDAYIETFQPNPDAKIESLDSMASRIAKRPRVRAEMERLRRMEADYALKRDERLAFALNPINATERMAVDLYTMATSSEDEKIRLGAWKLFGSMKHMDSWVRDSALPPEGQSMNDFGIKQGSTSSEAKSQLADSIKKLIGSRISERVIEIPKEPEDVGE